MNDWKGWWVSVRDICADSATWWWLYIYKLATLVEGDSKAPFSIATTPRCRGGRYSFPWIAILANTPDQAETLLHSLERAAASIGLHVNAHKTEYICYNQTGDISTLEGTPLKLVDKFTYLGSSVESTEKKKKKKKIGHRNEVNESMDSYQ